MDTLNSTLSFDNDIDKNTEKINIAQNIAMIVDSLPKNGKKVVLKKVDKKLLAEADRLNAHFNEKGNLIREKSPCINRKKNNFITITTETLVDKHLIPQIKKELGIDWENNKKKKQVERNISLPRINTVSVKNCSKKKDNHKDKSDFKLVSINKQ